MQIIMPPGRFEDIDDHSCKECTHPEHNPPTLIHIPPGKKLVWECPACGHKTIIIPPQITY